MATGRCRHHEKMTNRDPRGSRPGGGDEKFATTLSRRWWDFTQPVPGSAGGCLSPPGTPGKMVEVGESPHKRPWPGRAGRRCSVEVDAAFSMSRPTSPAHRLSTEIEPSARAFSDVPPGWAALVPAGEAVLASCRFDLDASGRFATGRMVLTDRRLLADDPATGDDGRPPLAWPLGPESRLVVKMSTSFGRLSLEQAGQTVIIGGEYINGNFTFVRKIKDEGGLIVL